MALYVYCEKDSLRAQIGAWLAELGVLALAVRGVSSEPYAQLVRERTATDGRPAVLLYVGELPPTAGKASDPRWVAWARRHGYDRRRSVQWEVEALDAAELQCLVLAAVERHVDRQALAAVVAEEARQRAALSALVSGWPRARAPGGEGR
ncbi:hypothetical protein ACH4D5_34015 [Streptomyces sp. NPDC018029]|uniref:hypothetical protein n=1 Tax=Streptomyces sp. NPDC018029 TaxID=3365032 RepID=UPI00379AA563